MPYPNPMSVVLRFPDVSVSRIMLEATLGTIVDRFQAARIGPDSYAQINIPEDGDAWADLVTRLEHIGPAIADLIKQRQIGQPVADLALEFAEDGVMATLTVPSPVVAALGRWGFAMAVSAYLTELD